LAAYARAEVDLSAYSLELEDSGLDSADSGDVDVDANEDPDAADWQWQAAFISPIPPMPATARPN